MGVCILEWLLQKVLERILMSPLQNIKTRSKVYKPLFSVMGLLLLSLGLIMNPSITGTHEVSMSI